MNNLPCTPIITLRQLGSLIRGVRKQRQLTQRDMAQKLGISQAAVSLMETAPSRVSLDRLFHVLAELDLEMVIHPKQSAPAGTDW